MDDEYYALGKTPRKRDYVISEGCRLVSHSIEIRSPDINGRRIDPSPLQGRQLRPTAIRKPILRFQQWPWSIASVECVHLTRFTIQKNRCHYRHVADFRSTHTIDRLRVSVASRSGSDGGIWLATNVPYPFACGKPIPLPVRSVQDARSSPRARPRSRCRAACAGRWRHRAAGVAATRRGAGCRNSAASYICRSCPRRARP